LTGTNAKNSDGCSACCQRVGRPFLLLLKNGIARPVGGADSNADFDRLVAAPAQAQAKFLSQGRSNGGTCSWIDATNNRCRHYEFRPDKCRSFEVGGNSCLKVRELHQIVGLALLPG
jgi:Fe-S-cluster containining protein